MDTRKEVTVMSNKQQIVLINNAKQDLVMNNRLQVAELGEQLQSCSTLTLPSNASMSLSSWKEMGGLVFYVSAPNISGAVSSSDVSGFTTSSVATSDICPGFTASALNISAAPPLSGTVPVTTPPAHAFILTPTAALYPSVKKADLAVKGSSFYIPVVSSSQDMVSRDHSVGDYVTDHDGIIVVDARDVGSGGGGVNVVSSLDGAGNVISSNVDGTGVAYCEDVNASVVVASDVYDINASSVVGTDITEATEDSKECNIEHRLASRDALLPPRQSRRLPPKHSLCCPGCFKTFNSVLQLKKHSTFCKAYEKSSEKTKNADKLNRYVCSICSAEFARALMLKDHMRFMHNNERPFSCTYCGKNFYRRHDLKMHLNIHFNIKSYVCDTCGHQFNHLSNLNRHQRTHTGVCPYVCFVCKQRFSQTIALKKHMRRHEGSKSSSNSATSHNRAKKKLRKSYCQVCGKTFTSRADLDAHELQEHSEPFLHCRSCAATFSSLDLFKNHACNKNKTKTRRFLIRKMDTKSYKFITDVSSKMETRFDRSHSGLGATKREIFVRELNENINELTNTKNDPFGSNDNHSNSFNEIHNKNVTNGRKSLSESTNVGTTQVFNSKFKNTNDATNLDNYLATSESRNGDPSDSSSNTVVMYLTQGGERMSYVIKKTEKEKPQRDESTTVSLQPISHSIQSNNETIMINVDEQQHGLLSSENLSNDMQHTHVPIDSTTPSICHTNEKYSAECGMSDKNLIKKSCQRSFSGVNYRNEITISSTELCGLSNTDYSIVIKEENIMEGYSSSDETFLHESRGCFSNDLCVHTINSDNYFTTINCVATDYVANVDSRDAINSITDVYCMPTEENDSIKLLESTHGVYSKRNLATKSRKNSSANAVKNSSRKSNKSFLNRAVNARKQPRRKHKDNKLAVNVEDVVKVNIKVELSEPSSESGAKLNKRILFPNRRRPKANEMSSYVGETDQPMQKLENTKIGEKTANMTGNTNYLLENDITTFTASDYINSTQAVQRSNVPGKTDRTLRSTLPSAALKNVSEKNEIDLKGELNIETNLPVQQTNVETIEIVCDQRHRDLDNFNVPDLSHETRGNELTSIAAASQTMENSQESIEMLTTQQDLDQEHIINLDQESNVTKENEQKIVSSRPSSKLKKESIELVEEKRLEDGNEIDSADHPIAKELLIQRIFHCPECPKNFNRRWNFEQHLAVHFPMLHRYRCAKCDKTFAYKTTYNDHMVTHTQDIIKYPCNTCNKLLKSVGSLRSHERRVHLKLRPHNCSLCSRRFAVKSELDYHLRLHRKEQPYVCYACGRTFAHSSHLHRHERLHTGERPHSCPHCPQAFIQAVGLYMHLKKHQQQEQLEPQKQSTQEQQKQISGHAQEQREAKKLQKMNLLELPFATKQEQKTAQATTTDGGIAKINHQQEQLENNRIQQEPATVKQRIDENIRIARTETFAKSCSSTDILAIAASVAISVDTSSSNSNNDYAVNNSNYNTNSTNNTVLERIEQGYNIDMTDLYRVIDASGDVANKPHNSSITVDTEGDGGGSCGDTKSTCVAANSSSNTFVIDAKSNVIDNNNITIYSNIVDNRCTVASLNGISEKIIVNNIDLGSNNTNIGNDFRTGNVSSYVGNGDTVEDGSNVNIVASHIVSNTSNDTDNTTNNIDKASNVTLESINVAHKASNVTSNTSDDTCKASNVVIDDRDVIINDSKAPRLVHNVQDKANTANVGDVYNIIFM